MATLENEHYLRTILLLCEGGAYISKQIIGRELPKYGGDLDALLKQFKNKINHEFHQKQMDKLFPNNGYDKTDINKWDIQMLIGVMLLLFRKTLSDEEKHQLREMKLIRHEVLAHSPSASLYIEKYEDVQKQLGDAIDTLAQGFDKSVKDRCKEYINTYASGPLEVKSAIKRLQEAKDTDDLFQEVINVIQKAQEDLAKQIHTAESNIRQDLKRTDQNISKGLKSVEHNLSQEIKDSTKAISKGIRDIESDVKDTNQHISKEISLVGGTVRLTKETLTKEIEGIKNSECNTFKALADVSDQIKNLQAWLIQNMRHPSNDRSATDLQHVSEDLRMKSNEIDRRMHTYDRDSSQAFEGVAVIQDTSGGFALKQIKHEALLVAAIDFGTTYSGYAFSTRGQYNRDPLQISSCLHYSGRGMSSSLKAPTAVLFDSGKQFHSFGYEAEDKYYELAADNEHLNWYFFKRFKMKLYTEKIDRNTTLQADNGEKMAAKYVFGAVIKYFKDHLMRYFEQRGQCMDLDDGDIHWILTVPAIWTDQAKQFMREAAITAGINGRDLSIALEPEAASIYCQTIPVGINRENDYRFATIHSGTKYMVIDLGGGTADITVHEKQSDGGLREIYKATGGAWGGTKVDEEFYHLLVSVLGKEVFGKFCDENKEDYLELQRQLECSKRNQRYSGKITLKVPVCLNEIYKEVKDETIETAVRESIYNGKLTWRGDKLRINVDVWNELFKPCCDHILRHLSSLLKNDAVKGTNVFVMVGGFSNCEIVQNAVKGAFPSVKVIIPDEADVAVLKGAVLFGHRPMAITSRVSKYTYGISISPLFDHFIHPEFRRVSISGQDRCRDVFKKYIYSGENVRVGDARSGEHVSVWPGQKEMKLKMYVSKRPNPMYVDEEDTECIGDVVVKLPQSDEQVVVNVKMMFGETELMVEATELSQGTNYLSYFDFL